MDRQAVQKLVSAITEPNDSKVTSNVWKHFTHAVTLLSA